jgi:hypothetical protein
MCHDTTSEGYATPYQERDIWGIWALVCACLTGSHLDLDSQLDVRSEFETQG